MANSFKLLGTGASVGVPQIGCGCAVCRSSVKYNKRLRPSALVEIRGKKILIDISPDFRNQALLHNISSLDAVIITHVHYDHIAGIDELRIFYIEKGQRLKCFVSEESLNELKVRYNYLFRPIQEITTISAQLDFEVMPAETGRISFQGIEVSYFSYFQGKSKVNGVRLGNLAYITDIAEYKEDIFESLMNLDTLIISAIRYETSPIHFNLEQAVEFAKKTKAKQVYLTHLSHDFDYDKLNKQLPKNMKSAYDGQVIRFS